MEHLVTSIDVATFTGEYPYRQLAKNSPDWLVAQLDRLGLNQAWVGYLPAILHRDPRPGNEVLHRVIAQHAERLRPVPTVDPRLPHWEEDIDAAVQAGVPSIRAYPMQQGLDPAGAEMRALARAAASASLPLTLTVRFEDLRQRHPLDTAADLPGAALRSLARCDPDLRILVAHADRTLVEEVHFGLTPDEGQRLLWDISWIWGPPENHLSLLLRTVGVERFTFGSGMPLRIPDAVMAKLDLLDLSELDRAAITGGNLERWSSL
jgi:predicted TIM-barrel fold metal-dependent hydrolase